MEMVRCGKLTKEQCKRSPFKHLVTRCLGHEKDVECDYVSVPVQPGDWIILASDGLEAALEEEDLPAIIQKALDPAQACSELVDKTLAGGAPDNVTVLTIHYSHFDGDCYAEPPVATH
jgi:protein phosphatase